jgi:hypothetical protein
MSTDIKLFENRNVRVQWDDEKGKWYFSVVDVVCALAQQASEKSAAKYWSVLKGRLKQKGNGFPVNCSRLKLPAKDGRLRMTDVADTEQILCLLQAIKSPKTEPFKLWLREN